MTCREQCKLPPNLRVSSSFNHSFCLPAVITHPVKLFTRSSIVYTAVLILPLTVQYFRFDTIQYLNHSAATAFGSPGSSYLARVGWMTDSSSQLSIVQLHASHLKSFPIQSIHVGIRHDAWDMCAAPPRVSTISIPLLSIYQSRHL